MALATGFARKYKHDLFFRTELNVIALQVLFTLVVLALIAVGFGVLYRDISSSLIESIMGSLASGAEPSSSGFIASELDYLKDRNIILLSSAIAIITALFGWLMTRLALLPTRNALESQKRFIGNIAHEIRTPLSIIKTNTEVTLFEAQLPSETRTTLVSTVEELDRISDILNNLLSINALVDPQEMHFANTDLGAVTDRALAYLTPLLERKRITVDIEKDAYCSVWGNAAALQQILANIIKNAAYYSPEGSTVRIRMHPDYRGHMELSVEDFGIGIAEADLVRIFEPFFRADESRARASGGSGLGLAIVSELIKLHKGRISISSAVNKGTTVRIRLPCGREEQKERGGKAAEMVERDFSSRRR